MTMQMSHKIIRIRTPCLGRHFGLLSCYLLDQQAYFPNTYRNPITAQCSHQIYINEEQTNQGDFGKK